MFKKILIGLTLIYNIKLSFSFLNFNKNPANNFKILNPSEPDKSKFSAVFLPEKFNNNILSYNCYSNFLKENTNNNIKLYIPDINNGNIIELCKELPNDKDENFLLISHSNSASDALQIMEECDKYKTLVLIDPISPRQYLSRIQETMPTIEIPSIDNFYENIPFYNTIIDNLSNLPYKIIIEKVDSDEPKLNIETVIKEKPDNNIIDETGAYDIIPAYDQKKNILVIKTKLSEKWSVFPVIPPIGIFNYDVNTIKTLDSELAEEEINDYGHYDILDVSWSDIIHNQASRGYEDRDPIKIMEYHSRVSNMINEFINK